VPRKTQDFFLGGGRFISITKYTDPDCNLWWLPTGAEEFAKSGRKDNGNN